MAQLNNLFKPGKIGKLEVKNRLVLAAMGTHSVTEDGYMNQRTIDYYVERAKGGTGLLMTHGATVAREARMPHMMSIYGDEFLPGLTQLATAVKAAGAKMICQISDNAIMLQGAWSGYQRPPDVQPVGPSAVPCVSFKLTPREITRDEIKSLIGAHADAAVRAKKAGFDGVEIHAAHGVFLSGFLSPHMNKRTDEYGGSLENRARFVCEIIERVRDAIGPDFPLLIRMNGSDCIEGGMTSEEAQVMAGMFVKAGVDAIDVTAAIQDSRQWRDLTYMHPDGAIVPLATAIKKAVKVPVIAVGKIGDPVLADRILKEGKADFIAMGRALLADPYLPNKAKEGRFDDIRYCLYCNNCRLTSKEMHERMETIGSARVCTVNPALLREKEFEIKPAPKKKKVMVVGGGLAGMQAATTLAERGHDVSLYEKDKELGGQWNIASGLPYKQNFATLSKFLTREINRLKVKVTLNKEVTKDFVAREKPDAIVIATGATSLLLNVPGANSKIVVQAVDLFSGKAKAGKKVVVIGGRLRGMEAADLLADQSKEVSIVTKMRLGEDGTPLERNIFVTLRDKLVAKRVMVYPLSPVFEIRDNGVSIAYNDELLFLPADTVVMAAGAKPENKLVEELKGLAPEIYAIGDCVKPENARVATEMGAEIGRKI